MDPKSPAVKCCEQFGTAKNINHMGGFTEFGWSQHDEFPKAGGCMIHHDSACWRRKEKGLHDKEKKLGSEGVILNLWIVQSIGINRAVAAIYRCWLMIASMVILSNIHWAYHHPFTTKIIEKWWKVMNITNSNTWYNWAYHHPFTTKYYFSRISRFFFSFGALGFPARSAPSSVERR